MSGHTFLLKGRLESIVSDAVVVPTDARFSVTSVWDPLLGPSVAEHRPPSWPASRSARSATHEPVWFLDVGRGLDTSVQWLADGLRAVLESVAAAGLPPSAGRAKPVVGLPVVGIGAGGFGGTRGDVVRAVIETAQDVTRETDLDIAIVAHENSVYAAAQHLRRQQDAAATWQLSSELIDEARRLGRLADDGELALFFGAGVSIPAGLPTWKGLLWELAGQAPNFDPGHLDGLPPLDQAELMAKSLGGGLGQTVARAVDRAQRPALSHVLLAALGVSEAVTTNYDGLYEVAVLASGDAPAVVMPWQVPFERHPWLLKMHGGRKHPESIVLTRRQFALYDAATRPSASLLQALLLTRHLLVVGASLTDDNVLRLAHEVAAYREAHRITGKYGTVLDVDDHTGRRRLWEEDMHWLTMSGTELTVRARNLEIFLDAVAAHATSDTSWLLDERFHGLLDDEERGLAHRARQLHADLAKVCAGRPAWGALADALRASGSRKAE